MQTMTKLTWASPFTALLIVMTTTFSGGLLIAMAQGSAIVSPYSSCTLVKGQGNTPLTNLQAGGKVSVGLNCQLRASSNSPTKPTGKNATKAIVSSSSTQPNAKPSAQPNAKGNPRPSASCQLVQGSAGNTPLHTTPLLTSLLQAVFKTNKGSTAQLGLNCQIDDGSFPTGIILRKNAWNCDSSGNCNGCDGKGFCGAVDKACNYAGTDNSSGQTGSWRESDCS